AARIAKTGNPIGRRFRVEATPSDPETLYEIVGLAANSKYRDLREDFSPVTYFPVAQTSYQGAGGRFVIRATLPLDRVTPAVRRTLMEIDPNIRYTLQVLETQISNSLLRERLMATLSTVFGTLAALLSAVGLYGVVSFLTARRRGEIGIRMALGAGRGSIVGM